MIAFKNILCPTDFSEDSQKAIRYALKLANENETIIHVLNVLEMDTTYDAAALTLYTSMAESFKNEAAENLNKLQQELITKFPNYHFQFETLENNDPAETINNYSKSNNIDLIVMATHGRKGLDRLLMGSVAESLMRMSNVPVAVIRNRN